MNSLGILSLKTDVNVPSKSNKQNILRKKNYFLLAFGYADPDDLPVPKSKCPGYPTLLETINLFKRQGKEKIVMFTTRWR